MLLLDYHVSFSSSAIAKQCHCSSSQCGATERKRAARSPIPGGRRKKREQTQRANFKLCWRSYLLSEMRKSSILHIESQRHKGVDANRTSPEGQNVCSHKPRGQGPTNPEGKCCDAAQDYSSSYPVVHPESEADAADGAPTRTILAVQRRLEEAECIIRFLACCSGAWLTEIERRVPPPARVRPAGVQLFHGPAIFAPQSSHQGFPVPLDQWGTSARKSQRAPQ